MLAVRNFSRIISSLDIPKPKSTLTSLSMATIKTFVFLDLETTGLPHYDNNTTRITELCAVSIQADHIELGCFPRVHNKLSLCFNPRKLVTPESTKLTGLSNDLLEHQSYFSEDTVDVLNKWLEMNRGPVCLVAHNGNKFDYPILRAELAKTAKNLSEDLVCIDSLLAFREIDRNIQSEKKNQQEDPLELTEDYSKILGQAVEEYENSQHLTAEEIQKINETTPKKQTITKSTIPPTVHKRNFGTSSPRNISYKLGDVYTRLTSKQPLDAHEAEGDVSMLIMSAALYGEKFVAYANENFVKLTEIPIMKPGRKIGT